MEESRESLRERAATAMEMLTPEEQGKVAASQNAQEAPKPLRELSLRERVLNMAGDLTGKSRNKIYGDPTFQHQVQARLTGTYMSCRIEALAREGRPFTVTAEDAAILSVFTKISRIIAGRFHIDNYIDAAAYMAIAGEAAHDYHTKGPVQRVSSKDEPASSVEPPSPSLPRQTPAVDH